jgi:dTDP-4-amino-4,6-dideoxy-D-galactose acyltransferase
MKNGYLHLGWDSEVFGFKVAKLTIAEYDESYLLSILKRLKENNYRLVYWHGRGAEEEILKMHGGNLVDEKVTYLKELKGKPIIDLGSLYSIAPYLLKEPEHALLKLAQESGAYSRFRLDPLFPFAAFEKLYNLWMIRSVRREIAYEVLVVKDIHSALCGVVTLGEVSGKGNIGLLAVASRARGQGLGRLLITAAEGYFFKHGYTEVEVVTQKENSKACHLYESCGYKAKVVNNVYHFWL